MDTVPSQVEKLRWFLDARLGTFIHFGPYAQYGRGEQVLFRETLDQDEYADRAMQWTAPSFNARQWASVFREGGSKYAVLTARHHDGFCLWETRTTSYCSARGAASRDFVRDYVNACRDAGLRVGLYYSLPDWRIPAYFAGPENDPAGFREFVDYNTAQVRELLTGYGPIDLLWFDGAWPHSAEAWESERMIDMVRSLQPSILVNDRLGTYRDDIVKGAPVGSNSTDRLSDYNTCEQRVIQYNRPWEACDTTTWELWGYTTGEHWKTPAEVIDLLCRVVSKGGTLLLNVGPKPDGSLPDQYVSLTREVGGWLRVNGEAIYEATAGGVTEFITRGWQTQKGNSLYCIIRFWDGKPTMTLRGIATTVRGARLLGHPTPLRVMQTGHDIHIEGLPEDRPCRYLPVIRLDFETRPEATGVFRQRIWRGDYNRMTPWAKRRRGGSRVFDYADRQ